MKIATVHLEGISPYGQSRFHNTPKLGRGDAKTGTKTESPADYEERTWFERAHINEDGFMFIPQMAFKNCLSEAAKYLSIQIPGKGKTTYTKHFEAGVLVLKAMVLDVKKKDIGKQTLFVPSDGRRGSGKRVIRHFPVIQNWSGSVVYHILDDVITEEVFAQHMDDAGSFIGLGLFRPRNNGWFGRFKVNKIEWEIRD